MRVSSQVVLWLCVVGAFANDFELIQQMTEYEFGKTIIQTIQIELGQGENSSSRIVDLLRQMKGDTEGEMQENTQKIRQRQGQCNNKLDEIDSVISQAKNRKVDDERAWPLKEEQLNDKNQQLGDKVQQEQRNRDRIAALDQARQTEKDAYNERRDDVTGLIAALGQAKQTISQLASRSVFLQRPEQVVEKLKAHSATLSQSNGNGYMGLIQMVLESATDANVQGDQKLVGNVIQIIDELVESLYHMQKVELSADDGKNQLYLIQRSRFELEITSLEGTLATLKADAERLKQTLLELRNDISSKEQVIQVKSKEFNDWKKTCVDESRNHERTQQQKNDELAIITQCIEIFDTRFTDSIKSYVQKMQIQN